MTDDFNKETDLESAQELTNFVKTVLNQMNDRFTSMTDNIIGKIDEMNDRINDLETTVQQLIDESNEVDAEEKRESSKGIRKLDN
jgi:heat shock factor-binding protein 1